jgi:hypothetical protein
VTQHESTTEETNHALRDLIDEAWSEYTRNRQEDFVVTSSIPILFFGDLNCYLTSPIRIVTVGLNPSCAEFPKVACEDRLQRFPEARDLRATVRDVAFYQRYVASLSDYFRTDPYMKWFNAYEHILKGMDGSYCDGACNTALHTDICSPLATDPTWSRLDPIHRDALESRGTSLWHRLIMYLAPDVLLVSIAKGRRDKITFQPTSEWKIFHTIPRGNPYHVQTQSICVNEGKDTCVIFGRAANTPFGTVSNVDKGALGARVKEYING